MVNNTSLKVPKKYEHMIQEVIYDRWDKWFIYLNEGCYSPETGCQTIHEYTQADALKQIREIKEENKR